MFDTVTTYPVIVTLFKGQRAEDIRYLVLDRNPPNDLGRVFDERAQMLARARLASGSWRLEGEAMASLRDKITNGRVSLGEVYGSPLRGILTGLNEAFIKTLRRVTGS